LVADLSQPVNGATVQPADLVIDGSRTATSVRVVDADTVEFLLPALAAGSHTLSLAAGSIRDLQGGDLDAFSASLTIAGGAQFTVNHNPRLQPGNAPLPGYAGSELDRVDLLWQTISAGAGNQDSFSVEYRASGAGSWQTAALNASIATGVENRVVHSASITGLQWDAPYEYRVRHRRADVIVGQYQSTFRTRLESGDLTSFSFAAYGDSASGVATGFRQVQSRINEMNPAFAVLLGDNVYNVGSHQESDARFDPAVNPEAAAWMAGHIDYLGLGNHDVATASGLPSEQNYSVPIPVAGVTAPVAPPASERPEHSFSWDYGSVHFLTFDTNSYTDATRLDALLDWAVADLDASQARWKIVYGHHPLAGVPDKPEDPGDNYYQQVVNRLKAAGVDLFMTGHSHTYSWTYPLTGQIDGTATYADHGRDDHFHAGEGLPQLVSGVGGVGIRAGDYSQFPFVAKGFTASTDIPARLGFSRVDVTPDQLTISYIGADDGAIIDSFVLVKDSAVQTAVFQQGAGGYAGTVDTFLHQAAPGTNHAAAASLNVDGDDPPGSGQDAQALLRFESLFGAGAGQIPLNATLRSATLELQVTNGSVHSMNVHRMLASWSATDTWTSLASGVQTNGIEAAASPDTSSGQSQLGALSFNVLASLQTWQADPASNLGWILVSTGDDGVDFHSSEGATPPKLIVTYVVHAPLPEEIIVAAPAAGHEPRIRVLDGQSGAELRNFLAFASHFTGGVRVATGDISGDGTPDIIATQGPGGTPLVRVFDGASGELLPGPAGSFFAYHESFRGGVFVASGDVDGDGRDDIVTGAGAGGGPHVKVFSGVDGTELFGFFAYHPNFGGGVAVALGDVDADGHADVITGAGVGGGPHVKVTSGRDHSELFGFFAYHPNFGGGVFVAAGNVNGDQYADIYTGAGAGGGPHVRVVSGLDRSDLHSFFAYHPAFGGGVRVAAGDLDGDALADVITAAGPGGGPHVRGFSGVNLAELRGLFAFDPAFSGGVWVGGGLAPGGSSFQPAMATPGLLPANLMALEQLEVIRAAVIAGWDGTAEVDDDDVGPLFHVPSDVTYLPGPPRGGTMPLASSIADGIWSVIDEHQERLDVWEFDVEADGTLGLLIDGGCRS
jgi:hypothetical protein